MNVHEASQRFYVRGASYEANRYFKVSEELRRCGWSGVGDVWFDEYGWRMTFKEAMDFTNLRRWYAYEMRAEASMLAWEEFSFAARDIFKRLAEKIAEILDRIDLSGFSGRDTERYTAYEEAWFEWADETGEMRWIPT